MASSIVKSAAQQLGNFVVDEAKYLYKVRDKIERLQTELKWMECFLRDADTQQHQEEIICEWVSQVRDLAYEAEDIIERYLHDVHHHRRDGIWNTLKWFSSIIYTCDAWTMHNLGSEIENMTIQITELTYRLQRYGIQIIKPTRSALEYNSMSRDERRTYSHIKEDVVGLENDIQLVVDQLLKANVNVVGISGIGGLGKTTLARKVFLNKEMQNQYVCVWVYISQEFEKTRIFEEILSGIDKGKGGNVSAANLPGEIDELLKNKKCFVVLDDIWTVDAWQRLEPAFHSIKSSPSKILLTTRKQDLLQHADSFGYLHRLKPLSLEDSWELLQRKAFIRHGSTGGELLPPEQNDPQDDDKVELNDEKVELKDEKVELKKLGMEMLKHCDGLPLAIVVLGGILSTKKTIAEWKEVQQNIASYLMSGEQGHESSRIEKVLELSYHDLPFYLKPCFLYLGNFPEDYEISTEGLYHLWEAEGLLPVEGKAKKQGETSYDVGERYLNELVQRSMVQVGEYRTNGRIKTCKVHDIMRDLCLKKGEEINFLNIVEWNKRDVALVLASCCGTENKKQRRCAIHWKGDDVDESCVTTRNHGEMKKKTDTCIRSILVFVAEIKVSRETWKPFPLLRVLDLERATIGGVLEGVEDLIHLRYLSLRYSSIEKLPARFYDLKCVETLDLRSWDEMKLPAGKLQMMERLRHLYLPGKFKVKDGKKLRLPVVGGRMETLKNFHPSKCEIEDLLEMTSLRIFKILKPYVFRERDELKYVLKATALKKAGQLINTVRLAIDADDILTEEPTINLSSLAGPPSSFELVVTAYKHVKDVVSRSIGFVDSLERLHLQGKCIEIGEADVLALGKLPHLKSLSLWGVTILGSKMSFSAGSFPHLNSLGLYGIMDLEDWEVMDGALPNLQRLELYSCMKLKKLPQGLPHSLHIQCYGPCIRGIENYNTCPRFKPDEPETCFNAS